MRVLLVGATGTIGRAVATLLSDRGHDVVAAHRRSAEWPIDLDDPASVADVYRRVGTVDAVACAAGVTPYAPLRDLDRDAYLAGLGNKFLGQVELVHQGRDAVRSGGSFTLISGVLARDPIVTGAVAAAVNGAIESWVRAAAIELGNDRRINAVSPTVLEESLDVYGDYFPGFPPTPVAAVARAYLRCIEGAATGSVYAV
jgi:NAD(P)-dependent dehydrogenase (short-subunit alcohol dehydrogenase family)